MQEALKKLRGGERLPRAFYIREDVVQVAQDLLGQILVSEFNGIVTKGIIVETEAYRAPDDQACHAANNRRTQRTETMFQLGGHAYVYLCYGIHHLFNVVTGPSEMAHAVLIRAIEPLENLDAMLLRRNMTNLKTQLSAGPGVLTKALGIQVKHDANDLCSLQSPIWIEKGMNQVAKKDIQIGTRVGVEYAGEDAFRPWRFSIKGNRWVSKGKGAAR